VARKRRPKLCAPEYDSGCGKIKSAPAAKKAATNRKVYHVLDEQNVVVSLAEQERFVDFLNRSIRYRKLVTQQWARNRLSDEDIFRLIQVARDSGDLDEAIWRSFLAAHFGRPSANPAVENQLESASLLLCGFGLEPRWTWKRVSGRPKTFRNWLYDHTNDLESLSFGNHRKFESQKPDLLWKVIESFIELAKRHGGPRAMVPSDDPFHVLYRRLSPLHRFGRTGCFDFLVMLLDLALISAEPTSCYLRGATGPKQGAELLWGKRPIAELDNLAAELAERLGVSPIVLEDALCNWQK